MTESEEATGPATYGLLPIPTDDDSDIGVALRTAAEGLESMVHVLVGSDDTGKSALLRTLASDYRKTSRDFLFFDLSITDWRELNLGHSHQTQVLIVDHIDRINEADHFSVAFDILDSILPASVASTSSALILSFNLEWRNAFRQIYRMNPETLLQRAIPTLQLRLYYIRPYDDAELTVLCRNLDLDPHDFSDAYLRRAGVLAMASSAVSEHSGLNGANLRDVLAMRWIQAGHDATARQARKAIWSLMGTITLQHGVFSIGLSELYAELHAGFTTATLRDQLGGPVHWEDDQLQPDSPSWGDVAAAKALGLIIKGRSAGFMPVPIRSTVLDALIDLSEPATLAERIERKLLTLEGADFATAGYLGPVLASLLTQVSASTNIAFHRLHLQGPDHHELRTVESEIVDIVEAALISSLEASVNELLTMLQRLVRSALSAYRGGYECWEAVRAWTRKLPLRAVAEDALSELLPHDGSWHYEDILDVSVTQATSRLMVNHAEELFAALGAGISDVYEYLADIWDGINDGAWDQIDATSGEFVSSLRLPSASNKVLDIETCRIQRARFGIQDAARWRLVDSDLFLSDLRSCRNLEKADLSGSNWWSAILPPPARYHLSRSCQEERFLNWCEAPPWKNPYFRRQWPTPFD